MTFDEIMMQRCFDLAALGAGQVKTNPLVGAVLVHEGRIIGEGAHRKYGEAHAEVNAVNNVKASDRPFIKASTLYVSLEPCCFFGKTPACTNLIIKQKIPKVIISCLDDTPEVNGKGVKILQKAGVEVITGVLEAQGKQLLRTRTTIVTKNRPYIILKFAQTQNGFMGKENEQIWISNSLSKRLVHKWRSEVDAILVGTNTAILDNPRLTNRLYFGTSPLRIVLDRQSRIPQSHHLLDSKQATLVVTEKPNEKTSDNLSYLTLKFDDSLLENLATHLVKNKVGNLLVEGGAQLLQSFLDQGLWDEIRMFQSRQLVSEGIKAPVIPFGHAKSYQLLDDELHIIRK